MSSILGRAQLGDFILGDVGTASRGKRASCVAYPDVQLIQPILILTASCLAYPDVIVRGNRGAVLATSEAFPDVDATAIIYYPVGTAHCTAWPDTLLTAVTPGAASAFAYPDAELVRRDFQEVSCIVAAANSTGDGEIKNGTF